METWARLQQPPPSLISLPPSMLPADLNFPPKQSSGSSGAGLRSSPPAGALPVPCPVGPPPPPPAGPPPLHPRPPSGSAAADSPPPLSVVADLNYRPKSNSGSSLAQSPPVTPSSSNNPNAAAAAKDASMSGGASAAGSDSPTHSQVMNRLGSLDARLGEALTPPGKKQIWHPDSREPSITDPKSGNE